MSEWKIMLRERTVSSFKLGEGDAVTIGRGKDADVVIDNAAVSRLHARFSLNGGEFRLTDLNSTNGCFVNSEKVIGSVIVDEVDIIEISKFRLVKVLSLDGEEGRSGAPTDLDNTVFVSPKGGEPVSEGPEVETPSALVRVRGAGSPARLPLAGKARLTIGKGRGSDLVVPGLFVGSPQCVIKLGEDGVATLVHTGSWRKTSLDGVAFKGRVSLRPGAMIAIASSVYRVE